MFVLDTCLVSEFAKKAPNTGVVTWMRQQVEADLIITTMTLGEVVKGIHRLPLGQKRSDLEQWYANDLIVRFQGRIHSLDEAVGYEWAGCAPGRELAGTAMPAVDSQIAAVYLLLGASLVTRNVADFAHSGVKLVNPWTQGSLA
ncbi:MAG: type II toxin-antitoxin system VapC family toxin [Verrucomicrobiaceae bacterium]|nr:type II toxin-antitoxin system VapC family toxin [Verrucomicrobiaceae bacterium]